jgi:hypothetical protein
MLRLIVLLSLFLPSVWSSMANATGVVKSLNPFESTIDNKNHIENSGAATQKTPGSGEIPSSVDFREDSGLKVVEVVDPYENSDDSDDWDDWGEDDGWDDWIEESDEEDFEEDSDEDSGEDSNGDSHGCSGEFGDKDYFVADYGDRDHGGRYGDENHRESYGDRDHGGRYGDENHRESYGDSGRYGDERHGGNYGDRDHGRR